MADYYDRQGNQMRDLKTARRDRGEILRGPKHPGHAIPSRADDRLQQCHVFLVCVREEVDPGLMKTPKVRPHGQSRLNQNCCVRSFIRAPALPSVLFKNCGIARMARPGHG